VFTFFTLSHFYAFTAKWPSPIEDRMCENNFKLKIVPLGIFELYPHNMFNSLSFFQRIVFEHVPKITMYYSSLHYGNIQMEWIVV
jgi:hypothetical protein